MGTGNGGDTGDHDAVSTATGAWEELTAPNGVPPANEFIVYAVSAGGACYYVDNASVNERGRPVTG
jgi:predicted secreted acid phosphatase